MLNYIYLDNATETKPSKEAVSASLTFMQEEFGNPFQMHKKGDMPFFSSSSAYQEIYELAKASSLEQFYFCSSSQEAINAVFLSTYLQSFSLQGKNHFIGFQAEEAALLLSLGRMKELGGITTILKGNKNGLLDIDAFKEAITPRTALFAISLVNGLTGVIQPLEEIQKICKDRGILLLVDGTHALGKIPIDFSSSQIDFLSFSGELLHALAGTGGLFVRNGLKFQPLVLGGKVNTPGLISLGIAAKEARLSEEYMLGEVARLKFFFEIELKREIPEVNILFKDVKKAPHITAVLFPEVCNETLSFLLSQEGVFVSIGGITKQPISHLLEGFGFKEEIAATAISFALSRYTTEGELEAAIGKIRNIYYKLLKGAISL